MEFLNRILLGGVAAAAIPLIIHLLNRSRYRVVRWGAMEFLRSMVQVNRRRVRLERLVLLLIRCAIPALLALCLARPVLTGWRTLAGDGPCSTVLLLDDSYSMQAGDGARTNFQVAVEQGGGILTGLTRGSDASIVRTAGPAAPVLAEPTLDVGRLADRLGDLEAEGAASTVQGAIEASADALAQMLHRRRSLVVISDFQKSDWAGAPDGAPAQLARRVRSLAGSPSLTLLRVGSAGRENVCVESLDLPRLAVGRGQELRLRANVRNFGLRAHTDLPVYFRVDGEQRAASRVSLPPGGRGQAAFACRFEEHGSHVIEVEIDSPDLKADNTRMAAIEVPDRLEVLLVDGDPNARPLQSETGFLAAALQPFASAGEEAFDTIEARTAAHYEFDPSHLAGMRAVVLANVPRLDDEQLTALTSFVESGGGLLVFFGDRIDERWYGERAFSDGAGLLPMRPVSVAAAGEDDGYETIQGGPYEHPALTAFNDPKNGDLTVGRILAWRRLAGVGDSGSAAVVARLAGGDPLLVEKAFGRGRVVLAATSCDADWSNLPTRNFYVPLMQRLAAHVASNTVPPRNVNVGRPLITHLPGEAAGKRLKLTDSDGVVHRLRAVRDGERARIEFTRTRRPGLYVLEMPDGRQRHFVVAADPAESNLESLSDRELATLAEQLGASVVDSSEQYARQESLRRFGRELWKPLLLAVIVLAFAEMWLAQRFARSKA